MRRRVSASERDAHLRAQHQGGGDAAGVGGDCDHGVMTRAQLQQRDHSLAIHKRKAFVSCPLRIGL